MAINYPNGKVYVKETAHAPSFGSTKTAVKNKTVYSNRGMVLEEDINVSNDYYLQKGIAVIHKKPIPIQIVKVDYPKRSAAVIKEAYFKQSSTTDYNGIYKGFYLDFEAKETKNKTSFPLSNFHEHQIIHMNDCTKHGGISFVLIRFATLNRVFLLENCHLYAFWEGAKTDGRKSIPLAYIEENAPEIMPGFNPRLDYLLAVDTLIANKKASS